MARIAMISEHASPLAALGGTDSGGQNIYVAQLASALADRGAEVDVFTRRDAMDLPEVVQWHPRARVIHVPAGPPAPLPKEELLPYMPEFTHFVRRVCRRRSYALLHAHFWMSGLVAVEIKQRLGIPVVVTFHALGKIRRIHQGTADRFPDSRFAIEERIVAEADVIVAECPQDRADLIEHYAAVPDRIATVPCGFDPTELWPVPRTRARELLGLPADAFIVLQLGRLVPRKGIATAVRGFARFANASGGKTRLLIVGGNTREPDPATTPEIARLLAVARSESASDRIVFTGQRGRHVLRYYYSAADVFVTLPWYEPFGITPLESMACGVPVIGSRVGGIKFTVRDGVSGCLIPPEEPGELAERLAMLSRNRRIVERMGRDGRSRVTRRFTWSRVAREMEGVYEHTLTPSGAGFVDETRKSAHGLAAE